jgi:methylenetetrahydrofolate dehydrogenase (NADP+)/methenyltetrahydrofolate cyclohydrolase
VTIIMRGKPVVERLYLEMESLKQEHPALQERQAALATLAVGDLSAANSYRTSIECSCVRAGIAHLPIDLPQQTSGEVLGRTIASLNNNQEVSGILVFMPLPERISRRVVLGTLSPFKDVDGITPESQGRLRLDLAGLRPSCPLGGVEILDFYGIEPSAKDVVVVGRSPVVGGPLSTMLMHRDATVTLAHRRTSGLAELCRGASIVALAAGSPGLLTNDMVTPETVVLDFGANMVEGKIRGDAERGALEGYVAALSPVPGGTGPATAAVLVRNVLFAALASASGSLDVLPRAGTERRSSPVANSVTSSS